MADPRVARGGVTYTLTAADGPGVETTYLEAVRQALFEEMERDDRVFVLGEDVGVYGGAFKATEGLLERFGEARVLDMPLAEEAIVGAAIGAAMRGMRPVAEMQFIDFISRAFDLLANFARRTGTGRASAFRSSCAGRPARAFTRAVSLRVAGDVLRRRRRASRWWRPPRRPTRGRS